MFVPKGVRLSEIGNNGLGKNLDKKTKIKADRLSDGCWERVDYSD